MTWTLGRSVDGNTAEHQFCVTETKWPGPMGWPGSQEIIVDMLVAALKPVYGVRLSDPHRFMGLSSGIYFCYIC